jgi:hypothetical protein
MILAVDPSMHTPLVSGTYRLIFSIDRPRWRTEVPGPTSTYQASVTLVAAW